MQYLHNHVENTFNFILALIGGIISKREVIKQSILKAGYYLMGWAMFLNPFIPKVIETIPCGLSAGITIIGMLIVSSNYE